eukprot:PhM_4_TR14155/c2_g1_i1/m.51645
MGCGSSSQTKDTTETTELPPSATARKKSMAASRLMEISEERFKVSESFRLAFGAQGQEAAQIPNPEGDIQLGQDTMSQSQQMQAMAHRRKSRRVSVAQIGRRRVSGALSEFGDQLQCFLSTLVGREPPSPKSYKDTSDPELNKQQDEQLKKMFDVLNVEGNGVTLENLLSAFQRLGYVHTDRQVQNLFSTADRQGRGHISWPEFHTFFRFFANANIANGEEADEAMAHAIRKVRPTRLIKPHSIRNYTVRTHVGCTERVKTVAVAPRMDVFAGASREDTEVSMWDRKTGRLLRIFAGHEQTIMHVAFSPDKKVLATCGRDGILITWDCTVGNEIDTFVHPGIVTCVTFSQDGKNLYTGCQDNVARKYTSPKCRLVRATDRTADRGVVIAISAGPEETNVLAVVRSCDKAVRIFDALTLRLLRVLTGHVTMVWSCSFNTAGLLASCCEKVLKVWDPRTGTLLQQVEVGLVCDKARAIWTSSTFCSPEFTHTIMVSSSDRRVHFYDTQQSQIVLSVPTKNPVVASSSGQESNVVLLGDDAGNIYEIGLT